MNKAMNQKRKWLEAYVMVISIIGVFSLFIVAIVYSFNGPSQSIWELIGLFIVAIIVLAWFVCLSILDNDLGEEEVEHNGTLDSIVKIDGLITSDGEISDDFIVRMKHNDTKHYTRGSWHVVDFIRMDDQREEYYALSSQLSVFNSSDATFRVFHKCIEVKSNKAKQRTGWMMV